MDSTITSSTARRVNSGQTRTWRVRVHWFDDEVVDVHFDNQVKCIRTRHPLRKIHFVSLRKWEKYVTDLVIDRSPFNDERYDWDYA